MLNVGAELLWSQQWQSTTKVSQTNAEYIGKCYNHVVINIIMFLFCVFCSKSVNVTSCDVARENGVEDCQVSVMQDFAHVGHQTVHISIRSYADNLTIHNQMLIFRGVIAGE